MSEKAEKEIDPRALEDKDDESEPAYTYDDNDYDPDDIEIEDINEITATPLNINTSNNPTTRRVRIYHSAIDGGAFILDSDFNEVAIRVIYPDAQGTQYGVCIYYFGHDYGRVELTELTHEVKNRIRRAKLPTVHASITMNYYLADARADLIPLYPFLKGTGLRIRLDYIYDFNNGETLYLPSISPNGIVLGLMNGKTCISSLLINIPTNKDFASFEYRTMKGIKNWRLLTKLLITAAVIVMPKISFPLGSRDHNPGDHLLDYLITYESDPSLLQFMVNEFNTQVDLTNDNNNESNLAILENMQINNKDNANEVTLEQATNVIDEFAHVKVRLMREQNGRDLNDVFRELASQLDVVSVQARNEQVGKSAPSKSTSNATKGGRRRTRRHKRTRTRRHRKSAKRHTKRRQRK